jgi:hypothetical protein
MPSADINDVWAQQAPVGTIENLTLPSGQTVNAKRVAVQDLVLAGVVGESDALTQFVQKYHLTSAKAKPDAAMKAALDDPKQFGNLMMMVDRIMPHVLVDPSVMLHLVDIVDPPRGAPKTRMIPVDERQPGVIYTDQIPLTDKVFLLHWAMGDVSQAVGFREEPAPAVANVEDVAGIQNTAQRPPRNRKGRKR